LSTTRTYCPTAAYFTASRIASGTRHEGLTQEGLAA
jgi:hypothetical protein